MSCGYANSLKKFFAKPHIDGCGFIADHQFFTLSSADRAEKASRQILSDLGYKNPPVNPLDVARKCGMDVAFVRFPNTPNVSGFYDPSEGKIYVNAEEGARRQAFTIAHELGHAILHQEWADSNDYRVLMRDMGAGKEDPKEKEANTFAAHLLVPRDMLVRFAGNMSIKELSDMFVVSEQMIGYRIAHEFS